MFKRISCVWLALVAPMVSLAAPTDEVEEEEEGIDHPDPLVFEDERDPADKKSKRKNKLVWFASPAITANSIDGLLFGATGQMAWRPKEWEFGYAVRLRTSFITNTRFDHFRVMIDLTTTRKIKTLARLFYRLQNNYPYAGIGGYYASTNFGEKEYGNLVSQLQSIVSVGTEPFEGTPLLVYGQQTTAVVRAVPASEGQLDIIHPFGVDGSLYLELAAGLEYSDRDRTPSARESTRIELALRGGMTLTREPETRGLGGIYLELSRKQPIVYDWFTFGARLTFDMTVGERPFFDQNRLGGRWRAELGVDQFFVGYGAYRFGGDGVTAALVEFEAKFLDTTGKRFQFICHAQVFAEEGFVFAGSDPGPHLPTVGFGLDLVFQGSIYLRPFLAWGWVSPEPNAPRKGTPLFGLSVNEVF